MQSAIKFFLVAFKWGPQISLLYRINTKYFISKVMGICFPWKYSGEHSALHMVKFTRIDFSGFIFIRHLNDQFSILFK